MGRSVEELNYTRLSHKQNHSCAVTEEDYARVMPKIELLQRMAEVERSVYAVYDMHRSNYLLKSEEQVKLWGSTDTDAAAHDDTEMHYANIHPDDLQFVLETDNLTYRFFAGLPAHEKKDYKLVYDFRSRNTDGNYMRYMHQSIILELDKNGKVWLSLVISHRLADNAESNQSQRRMIHMKTGTLHLFTEIDDQQETVLTKREREVLQLIGRGYDSINISDKLHISVNTVNNHRQNILRKTRTDNTTQALLYCKRLGIL